MVVAEIRDNEDATARSDPNARKATSTPALDIE
jgi:hypothetical protein